MIIWASSLICSWFLLLLIWTFGKKQILNFGIYYHLKKRFLLKTPHLIFCWEILLEIWICIALTCLLIVSGQSAVIIRFHFNFSNGLVIIYLFWGLLLFNSSVFCLLMVLTKANISAKGDDKLVSGSKMIWTNKSECISSYVKFINRFILAYFFVSSIIYVSGYQNVNIIYLISTSFLSFCYLVLFNRTYHFGTNISKTLINAIIYYCDFLIFNNFIIQLGVNLLFLIFISVVIKLIIKKQSNG